MKFKRLFNFIGREFVYGGHLLSLALVGVVVTVAIVLNIDSTWDSLLIVYLVVQIIYSYNRYKEIDQDIVTNPERSEYLKKQKRFFPFLFLLYLLLLGFLLVFYSSLDSFYLVLTMIFLGVGYTAFLKKFTYKILGFKSIVVALTSSLLVPYVVFYYSHFFGSLQSISFSRE